MNTSPISISYKRIIPTKPYGNDTVELEAFVTPADDEDPVEACNRMRAIMCAVCDAAEASLQNPYGT